MPFFISHGTLDHTVDGYTLVTKIDQHVALINPAFSSCIPILGNAID